jgi:hypothetical protein
MPFRHGNHDRPTSFGDTYGGRNNDFTRRYGRPSFPSPAPARLHNNHRRRVESPMANDDSLSWDSDYVPSTPDWYIDYGYVSSPDQRRGNDHNDSYFSRHPRCGGNEFVNPCRERGGVRGRPEVESDFGSDVADRGGSPSPDGLFGRRRHRDSRADGQRGMEGRRRRVERRSSMDELGELAERILAAERCWSDLEEPLTPPPRMRWWRCQ